MTITLTPELENAIARKALESGAKPEQVALDELNRLFLSEDDGDSENNSTLAERMAQFIGMANDLPIDMAENHDHYIHGAPKR